MSVHAPVRESADRTAHLASGSRIVIKVGTSVLRDDQGGMALTRIEALAASVAALRTRGHEVVLVSSGAVGLGADHLGVTRLRAAARPACAAVGQGQLMAVWARGFERVGLTAAQLLVTRDDLSDRQRYLDLRTTVTRLLSHGAVPVVNENDAVSAAVRGASPWGFTENDRLAALVASKIDARLLLLLTDVDGVYEGDPRHDPNATRIAVVGRITPELEAAARGPHRGSGGMRTKIEAARIAIASGCAAVIADGREPHVITRVVDGESVGTWFVPRASLSARKRWIAFATAVHATIVANEGARRAVLEGAASLLAVGVVGVVGGFGRGAVVRVVDERGDEFARGVVNYDSEELQRLCGDGAARHNIEVMTREDLAPTGETHV